MGNYAYIRVSTKDQNLDRQIISMEEIGIEKKNIFYDKKSGKNFDRPGYIRLMKTLRPRDTLYIKSIDRLGRNYSEIIIQWQEISKRNIAIVVLDMPMLDTRPKNVEDQSLTSKFLSDMVLQIMSYTAQVERELNLQRQAEGIAAAKAKGKKLGRKRKPQPENYLEVYRLWKSKKISSRQAGTLLNVSHSTFLSWAKETDSG